jgi:hypothetical protein
MNINRNRKRAARAGARSAPPARLIAVALALAGAFPAGAEGLRNIASFTIDNWFDGTWRTEVEDVFLARVVPALTLQAKVARSDSDGWYRHFFAFGPVVSFTDTLYLVTAYGLGIDSDSALTHEAEVELNRETADAAASIGLRVNYVPDTDYSFLLPSMSWRIRVIEPLSLFSKLFLSVDSDREMTGSVWGEADYQLSPVVNARGGFTVSYADGLGYSVIGGVTLSFTRDIVLKYSVSYLGETVEYLARPETRQGFENALILDVKF